MTKYKRTKYRKALLLFIIFYTGIIFINCATTGQSTQNHTLAQPVQINNERSFNKSVDEVWDSLVKELSKSFFVINNIDKDSRIINVSFYTDSPEDYVDCGTTSRSWSGIMNTGSINYKSAQDSQYFYMYKWGPYRNLPAEAEISRKTSLEGRMNIYVAPSGNGTLTTVNCRYIFKSNWTANEHFYNAFGGLVNTRVSKDSWSNTFNTNKPNLVDAGAGQMVRCCSNGKLEQEILGFIE